MTDDELRRRLYRPGAGHDDVAAYLAVAAAGPLAEGVAQAVADAPPDPPRRRGRPAVIAATLALAVGVAVLLAVVRSPASQVDAAAGAAPLPTRSVDPGVRRALLARLDVDEDAGLTAAQGPSAASAEGHGVGAGSVALPPAVGGSGRITVLLVLDRPAAVEWSVARLVIADDRTIHLAAVAGATGTARAGTPVVGRVRLDRGVVPRRLLVVVPAGTRWGAAVVATG